MTGTLKMKIAILTNFREINPWYSLTGIVKDQIRMLNEYGNDVSLFVDEEFIHPLDSVPGAAICRKMPHLVLHDYQDGEEILPEHKPKIEEIASILSEELKEYSLVFTHDLVFTGWNRPFAEAIQKLKLPHVRWMHWIHSIPSGNRQWWNYALYGKNHVLIFPNRTDACQVASHFLAPLDRVKTIPHIKDLRTMFNFSPLACEIIARFPKLMDSDLVQIYPVSSDRFEAKGIHILLKIFGNLKRSGHSVFLFIANSHSTTAKQSANIDAYYQMAKECGLTKIEDVIFASSLRHEQLAHGIPFKTLVELMQLSNLFIFPTNHESFGLILPEVSLASGALCVLNRSLTMQYEVGGGQTLYFDFGSYTQKVEVPPEEYEAFLSGVALTILGRFQSNDSVLTRTFMRKRYNYDSLYKKYYLPLIAEMSLIE